MSEAMAEYEDYVRIAGSVANEIAELKAENARLREALALVQSYFFDSNGDYQDIDPELIPDLRDVLREALDDPSHD